MTAKDQKLKDRIAAKRQEIKDLQGKRAELRAAAPAKAAPKAKAKRAPARRKSSRSTQAQASA